MQIIKELKYYIIAAVTAFLLFGKPEAPSKPAEERRSSKNWTHELRQIIESEYDRNVRADSVVATVIEDLALESDLDIPSLQLTQEGVVR